MSSSPLTTNSKTAPNVRRARGWRRLRPTTSRMPSLAALLALDQEDLAANAGRTRYGYVEPTEAAWSLLEAAVEPWLEDITRRASLGLIEAARRLGLGTLRALESAERHIRNDDLLVSWAPDFPDETADRVVELLRDAGIELTDAERALASDET